MILIYYMFLTQITDVNAGLSNVANTYLRIINEYNKWISTFAKIVITFDTKGDTVGNKVINTRYTHGNANKNDNSGNGNDTAVVINNINNIMSMIMIIAATWS